VIQADQLADLAKRQPVLLRLREGFTSSFPRGLAVPLKLLLGSLDGFARRLPLGIVGPEALSKARPLPRHLAILVIVNVALHVADTAGE
jgi:hypothetical protein